MDQSLMTIGQLARASGTTIDTIRHYEKINLLTPTERDDDSGYRYYGKAIQNKVIFIKSAQGAGFTLKEISELLALKDSSYPCSPVQIQVTNKINTVDKKIKELKGVRSYLSELLEECIKTSSEEECAVLEHFDNSSLPKNN